MDSALFFIFKRIKTETWCVYTGKYVEDVGEYYVAALNKRNGDLLTVHSEEDFGILMCYLARNYFPFKYILIDESLWRF